MTIEGSVEFHAGSALMGAKAYIRVRDVSLADAAAPIVAEQVVTGITAASGGTVSVPFRLAFPPAPGADYNLEAHISASGAQDIKAGDYLTVQSFPVPLDRATASMRVEARAIGEN